MPLHAYRTARKGYGLDAAREAIYLHHIDYTGRYLIKPGG